MLPYLVATWGAKSKASGNIRRDSVTLTQTQSESFKIDTKQQEKRKSSYQFSTRGVV